MSSASLPDNEHERLLALYECDVLDTPPDPLFDGITALAAQVCEAPIALFSLIDRQRQWFKSNQGLPDIRQTSRDMAFCAHAILGEELLEVPDTTRDARFSSNPLVVYDPKIRFYAGMPLRDAHGLALGACASRTMSRVSSRPPNGRPCIAWGSSRARFSSNGGSSAGCARAKSAFRQPPRQPTRKYATSGENSTMSPNG